MDPLKRQLMLVGVMLVMVAIGALWSYRWMDEQREAAQYEANTLAECQHLAEQIEALRDKPTVASAASLDDHEILQKIAAASQQARIGDGVLAGTFPQPARSLGDTPYQIKPTSITLRGITLQQLTTLLHHLSEQSSFNIRNLRLRTPHGETTGNLWDADATITYLIYAPQGAS